jgi:hypothetical protein
MLACWFTAMTIQNAAYVRALGMPKGPTTSCS